MPEQIRCLKLTSDDEEEGGGVESIHIFKLVKAAEKKLGEQIYEVYIGVSGVVKVKSCCCCLSCIHL